MKKNKHLPFIAIAVVVMTLVVSGCGTKITKEKTVGDVADYFKNSGLKVEDAPALSGEEKELVEDFQDAAKSMGLGKKSDVIESKSYMVESVKIKIMKYKDAESAQKAYDYFIGFEERKKKRNEEKSTTNFQTSYFLNNPFLLQIRHYDAKLVSGGIVPEKIEVKEEDVAKIQKVFVDFK